jgi:thiol-disulfide isomerase/thioredoxin
MFVAPIDRILALRLVPLVLLAAVLPAALSAAELPPLSHRLTVIEDPAPAPPLRLEDLDGVEHDLADLKGQLVLVNFWATWCPPCRREMPSMERLYQQLRERGLMVLAVDVGEDVDTIFSFTGQLDPPPTFPLLLDPDSRAAQDWKVKGLPTSFVVDPEGRVVIRAVGGTEFDDPEKHSTHRLIVEPSICQYRSRIRPSRQSEAHPLDSFIQTHEATIRLVFFFGIFALMAIWEVRAPRRARTLTRLQRWTSNLGLVVLNTLVLRILFPAAAVGMALFTSAQGWGLLNAIDLPGWLAVLVPSSCSTS